LEVWGWWKDDHFSVTRGVRGGNVTIVEKVGREEFEEILCFLYGGRIEFPITSNYRPTGR
jgi:hypothetical protein